MTTATLPKRAHKLIALAKKHGWEAEIREDAKPIDGATESAMLAFDLRLASGRAFVFAVVVAKSTSTNRWQFCQNEGYRVTGALFPGNGTDRDRMASMLGSVLVERRWKAISNLEWWLARPEGVMRFDWVDDEVAT